MLINLETTLVGTAKRVTMSPKIFALFLIGAAAVSAVARASDFNVCQCCGDDPPERCSQMRIAIPCDKPQFQAMCSEAGYRRARRQAFCPTIWAPVCGTNGKTYSNECMANGQVLNNKNCLKRAQIQLCPLGEASGQAAELGRL